MEKDFVYKVYAKLDKDKVQREGKYSQENMIETLDNMALKCELIKDDDGWYVGKGENSNGFMMALLNTKWFLENCQEWLLGNVDKNIMEDAL